jgi:hypothetical protein
VTLLSTPPLRGPSSRGVQTALQEKCPQPANHSWSATHSLSGDRLTVPSDKVTALHMPWHPGCGMEWGKPQQVMLPLIDTYIPTTSIIQRGSRPTRPAWAYRPSPGLYQNYRMLMATLRARMPDIG